MKGRGKKYINMTLMALIVVSQLLQPLTVFATEMGPNLPQEILSPIFTEAINNLVSSSSGDEPKIKNTEELVKYIGDKYPEISKDILNDIVSKHYKDGDILDFAKAKNLFSEVLKSTSNNILLTENLNVTISPSDAIRKALIGSSSLSSEGEILQNITAVTDELSKVANSESSSKTYKRFLISVLVRNILFLTTITEKEAEFKEHYDVVKGIIDLLPDEEFKQYKLPEYVLNDTNTETTVSIGKVGFDWKTFMADYELAINDKINSYPAKKESLAVTTPNPSTPTEGKPLSGMRITINPGHLYNGSGSGDVKDYNSPNKTITTEKAGFSGGSTTSSGPEGQTNYILAVEVAAKLEELGATVDLIDTKSINSITNSERAMRANKFNAHLSISIHHDAPYGSGSFALYTDGDNNSWADVISQDNYKKGIFSLSEDIRALWGTALKNNTLGIIAGVDQLRKVTSNEALTGLNWSATPYLYLEVAKGTDEQIANLLSKKSEFAEMLRDTVSTWWDKNKSQLETYNSMDGSIGGSDIQKYTGSSQTVVISMNRNAVRDILLTMLNTTISSELLTELGKIQEEFPDATNAMLKKEDELNWLVQTYLSLTDTTGFSSTNSLVANTILGLIGNMTSAELKAFFNTPWGKELLTKKQENSVLDKSSSGEITDMDLEAQYFIEMLAGVKRKPDINERYFGEQAWGANSDSPLLKKVYIAMIASSGVYTPLRSYAGDKDYQEALKYLMEDAELAEAFHNRIKDIKKPLYYTQSNQYINYSGSMYGTSGGESFSGTAKIARLKDLIYLADNQDQSAAFFTHKGQFEINAETGQWNFFEASPSEASYTSSSEAGTAIPAGETVSSNNFTATLLEVGPQPGTMATTQMLITNIFKNSQDAFFIKQNEEEILYMNPVGDIVLSNNIVVVPAASNPLLYSFGNEIAGFNNDNSSTIAKNGAYNPYTVAFAQYYPNLIADLNQIHVDTDRDINKNYYMISRSLADEKYPELYQDFFTNNNSVDKSIIEKPIFYTDMSVQSINSANSLNLDNPARTLSLYPYFYRQSTSSEADFYSFLKIARTDKINTLPGEYSSIESSDVVALVFENAMVEEGTFIFPYNKDLVVSKSYTSPYTVPKMIAKNLYWYMTHNTSLATTDSSNGVIRDTYLYYNWIVEGLQGSQFVNDFKNQIVLNERLNSKALIGIESLAENIARAVYESIADMKGVIGFTSAETNIIFGSIIEFLVKYSILIFLVFVFLIFLYYSKQMDLTATLIRVFLGITIMTMYVTTLPYVFSFIGNMAVDMMSNDLITDILLVKLDEYSGQETKTSDNNNKYVTKTNSIELYSLNEIQVREISDRYKIPLKEFRFGKQFILDTNSGLFIQGNKLYMNLDTLFKTNYITVNLNSSSGAVEYTSHKKTSSVIDYYVPYYMLQDGLLETLNTLQRAYRIPRSTITYSDGSVRDSYLYRSYVKSKPFLYGKDLSGLSMPDTERLKLEVLFEDPEDFLNLNSWIHEPPEEFKNTLWYHSLLLNDFYSLDKGRELREDLVFYMNYHLKEFIIRNKDMLVYNSDENITKILTMQSVFLFNNRVSRIGSWIRPQSYNVSDLTLGDVVMSSSISGGDIFKYRNSDPINVYTSNNKLLGSINVLILSASLAVFNVVLVAAIVSFFVLIPIAVIKRMLTGADISTTVLLFFKSFGVLYLAQLLMTILMLQAKNLLPTEVLLIVLPIFVCILTVWFLLSVFNRTREILYFFAEKEHSPLANLVQRNIIETTQNMVSNLHPRNIMDTRKKVAPIIEQSGNPISHANSSRHTYGSRKAIDYNYVYEDELYGKEEIIEEKRYLGDEEEEVITEEDFVQEQIKEIQEEKIKNKIGRRLYSKRSD